MPATKTRKKMDKAEFRRQRQALIEKRRSEAKQRGGGGLKGKRFRWPDVDKHALIRLIGIGGTPGLEIVDYYVTDISLYSKTLKMGTTSPATFGLRCPINDWLNENWKTFNENERKELKQLCNRESIFLTFGFDLSRDPSPDSIKPIEIKMSMMDKINDQMAAGEGEDPEDVPDVFDIDEGCAIHVTKDGTGIDTKYGLSFRKYGAIVSDEDLLEEIREKLDNMSLWDFIYKPNWDKVEKMYMELTGEDMPHGYREQDMPDFAVYTKDEGGTKSTDETEPETEGDEPDGDEADIVEGTRVSVDYDGEAYEGVVTGVKRGKAEIDFDNGDQDTIPVSDCEVLEAPEEEEPEEEPEEEAEEEAEEAEVPERVSFEDEGETVEGTVTGAASEDGDLYYSIDGDDGYEYEKLASECVAIAEEEEAEEEEEEPEPAPPRRTSKKTTKKKASTATKKKTTKKSGTGAAARLAKLRKK